MPNMTASEASAAPSPSMPTRSTDSSRRTPTSARTPKNWLKRSSPASSVPKARDAPGCALISKPRPDNPTLARRVIDHLVGERLLTIRSDPNNLAVTQVDIAHEILIDRWTTLKDWLDQDRASLRLREEVARRRRIGTRNKDVSFLVHRGSRWKMRKRS